jgi:hypothetical protein
MAGYGARDAVRDSIDVPRAELPGGERVLPQPVVETVEVRKVLEALRQVTQPTETETFVVRVLEVFCDVALYRQQVLETDFVSDVSGVCHRASLTRSRLMQLKEKGYIQRVRGRQPVGVTCPLMFVPKDDKEDRTIWNGKKYNKKCRRPLRCPFERMHDMFRSLTQPGGRWYLAYDFSTWFVQLLVHMWIHETFLIRLADGSIWRLCGVPMGFTWAPLLAQCVALALLCLWWRALSQRVRDRVRCWFVYVDNVIVLLDTDDQRIVRETDEVFRRVCASFGVVLKEKASVSGTSTDWLGVIVTAGSREVTFRQKILQKVTECVALMDANLVRPARVWWRMVDSGNALG